MDPIDRTAPSVPPSPPTPDSRTGHSSRVAETGRDALAKRAAESEKKESLPPLKKGRLEQYGEFKAAFIALQTLCATGKDVLFTGKPFAEKCLEGLSKVYRLWPAIEKDDVEMIENYTNKISGLIEDVLYIAASAPSFVVSNQTEQDLVCITLETTPPEQMNLVPLMIFARKGALPNCSGNQGTAVAKLLCKLLEHVKSSGKCPDWTLAIFYDYLQKNPHWIDEDFINEFFYKLYKSDRLSRLNIDQLSEEGCLFYLSLMKMLFTVPKVMQLPHSSVNLILSLFNHLQDPFKALPHLKTLCKHEWFPNVWAIMPALAQRFSRYDPTTDGKVPDENLDNLNLMCHIRTPDKLPTTGQEALVQYLKNKFESNPQRPSLRLTEISLCAHFLAEPLFVETLKALLPLGAHALAPEVPAICLLEHPDAELINMLQPVLNRYQIDAKATYLYVLHLFAQHSQFKVTVIDRVGFFTLLCQEGKELLKLMSLPTYFRDPAIRNSPEALQFFKQILECDSEYCYPLLILGKLAEQGSLPEGYEMIVHGLLKKLPLQPNALETTSQVFEALGYLTRANAFSKITLPEILELEKWLFIPDGTRSQFYPFSLEQKQRISVGVRALGVERNLPIPQSWIDHFVG